MLNGVKVFGIHAASGIDDVIPRRDLIGQGRHFDLILCNKENFPLLARSGLTARSTFFVDSRDDPYLCWQGLAFDHYLKRELLRAAPAPRRVKQLSFGIERRYLTEIITPLATNERPIDVLFAMSLETNKCRALYQEVVRYFAKEVRGRLRIDFLGTAERAYDNRSMKALPTPEYREKLRSSKVVISCHGAGEDCARYWETLASGALLLSESLSLVQENPLDGRSHCLYFKNPGELLEQLRLIFLERGAPYCQIARNGRDFALEHHSTLARGAKVISLAEKHIERFRLLDLVSFLLYNMIIHVRSHYRRFVRPYLLKRSLKYPTV